MGKLSHIDDVEQRQAAQAASENEQAAQAASADTRVVSVHREGGASSASAPAGASADGEMTASEEEQFHGLDERQPLSTGHKFLIVAAVIVLAATVLYIVNSWIHFV